MIMIVIIIIIIIITTIIIIIIRLQSEGLGEGRDWEGLGGTARDLEGLGGGTLRGYFRIFPSPRKSFECFGACCPRRPSQLDNP